MINEPSLYATVTFIEDKAKVNIGIDPQLSPRDHFELLESLRKAVELAKADIKWEQSSITSQS